MFKKQTILFVCLMLFTLQGGLYAVTCTTTAPGVWDCGAPATNDNLVVNHAVTITGDFNTNGSITINAGGDLTVTGLIMLTTSGSLVVNSGGILSIGTTLDVRNMSSITLNSGGTINVANLDMRNDPTASIAGTLTATGFMDIRNNVVFTVTSRGSLSIGGNSRFFAGPTLAIESGGQICSTGDFRNDATATVDGELKVGGQFRHEATLTGTGLITYATCSGAGTINGEAAAVWCDGSGTILLAILAGNFVVNDGIPLRTMAGTTISILGSYVNQTNGADGSIDNQGTIELTGNWINNAGATVFSTGAGFVIFNGTVDQSIQGTFTTTFEDLVVNKASGELSTLTNNYNVANMLTLTNGIINTSATSLLILLDGATASSGSASTFVDGPLRKVGNNLFTFPVGEGTVWARIAISAPMNAADAFTAQYFDGGFSDTTVDASLNKVTLIEYWTLDRTIGTSNVTVQLFWEDNVRSDIDLGVSSTDLVVARYDGADWTDETQAGGINFVAAGDVTSQTVTSFSPFTFGSLTGSQALPIELLDFKAILHENWVELLWATASEKNNDFFTVERSQDALTFEELLEMDGVGDSEEIVNYQASDEIPLPGLSFYRLKQTDFDGAFTYSHLVSVNNLNNFGPDEINIYPHPSIGSNFTINIAGNINQNIQLDIYDINGNKRFSRTYSEVDLKILIGNQLNLESGVYIVRAQGINFVTSRKLLIN